MAEHDSGVAETDIRGVDKANKLDPDAVRPETSLMRS